MCQFITIVLPKDVKLEKIESVLIKHGFGCQAFQNDFILHQIPKGGQLVNTTVGHCDCGSVIASATLPSSKDIKPNDIEQLKRKGWSETKIKNWIESKSKANTQTKTHDMERAQWTNFLEEVLVVNKIGKIGLFIHWYDNSMKDEELVFKNRETLSIKSLKGDTLDNMNNDILYEFIS